MQCGEGAPVNWKILQIAVWSVACSFGAWFGTEVAMGG